MSIQFLLDNFEQLFDSEEKIKNFDKIILQLAVSGRLNTQHLEDEPASDLLKRITTEKQALIKAGKLKAQKPLPPIDETEAPFQIPPSWVWNRLGEVGAWGAGSTPNRGNPSYYNGEITWFKSGELKTDIVYASEEKITELALKECSLRLNQPNDVMIAMYGATIGKVALAGITCTTNQAICACTPFSCITSPFLLLQLKALYPTFVNMGAGGAQPNISREKIVNTPFPLPPFDEQKRIVAKVEELLSKSAEIKEYFSEKNKMRVKLNQSLLHHLQESQNHEEFKKNFDLITSHFNDLYDNQENMKALRQTILQLAVSGRLNTQDPEDEPASDLLKRITTEKQALIKAGQLKAQKPLPPVAEAEQPFTLPDSWVWTRLGQVCDVRDGTHDTPKYRNTGIPLITSKNLSNGKIDFSNVKLISEEDYLAISKRSNVEENDILFAMIGSIGNPVLVQGKNTFAIKNVALFKGNTKISPSFLLLCLKASENEMKTRSAGGVQPFVSLTFLRNYNFPLPPLAEQQRIVAKVGELMALCDALEAHLTQQQAHATALLNSLVHELVGVGSL